MEVVGDLWDGGRDDEAVLDWVQSSKLEMLRGQYGWVLTKDTKNMLTKAELRISASFSPEGYTTSSVEAFGAGAMFWFSLVSALPATGFVPGASVVSLEVIVIYRVLRPVSRRIQEVKSVVKRKRIKA
jgi:hypothetical protein